MNKWRDHRLSDVERNWEWLKGLLLPQIVTIPVFLLVVWLFDLTLHQLGRVVDWQMGR